MTERQPFWELKRFAEMSRAEWESLCDGCGKCCLVKLEDEADGAVYYTDVACGQLNLKSCRCNNYQRRKELVPECLHLQPADVEHFHWLPHTCSYRLLYEGKPLPDWHPLVSGNSQTVHLAGVSVRGKAVPLSSVRPDQLEERIVFWVDDQ